MVLAGEGPVDQLADGACFTQVVQQDHQGDVPGACLPVYLVGQVGEIQLQILKLKWQEVSTQQEWAPGSAWASRALGKPPGLDFPGAFGPHLMHLDT